MDLTSKSIIAAYGFNLDVFINLSFLFLLTMNVQHNLHYFLILLTLSRSEHIKVYQSQVTVTAMRQASINRK